MIRRLAEGLEGEQFVLACWLEGADALGRIDEFSDIDLWLDVRDGSEQQAIDSVRRLMKEFGPLEFDHEIDHPHPLIRQVFMRLGGVPEFLFLDLHVQSHSRGPVFVSGVKDMVFEALFDKAGVLEVIPLDRQEFERSLTNRVAELEETYEFFHVWVKKAVERRNFLEALHYYHRHVLAPLVELLRIRYQPTKSDYHLKDVEYDLPADVVRVLHGLYAVSSIEDIADRLGDATSLFLQALGDLQDEVRRLG